MKPSKEDAYRHVASLVEYDKETGVFTWLRREGTSPVVKRFNSALAGYECGSLDHRGYIEIGVMVNGHKFSILAHRLAWLIDNGHMPFGEIDHINQIRHDNKISNLRDVPTSINQRNARMRSDNSSGVTGVTWHKQNKKWHARVDVNGVQHHLGYFDSIECAKAVIIEFRSKNNFTDLHGVQK